MLQTLTLEKPASKIFSNFGVKISKTKSALPHNISQSRPCFSHVLKSVCHSRVCAAVSIAGSAELRGGMPGWKERRRMTWFGGTNGEDVGERLGYAGGCDVTGG